ncbi:MAG: hypothetical protein MJ108_08915 [Saccharofermentans sp.]|nr:hypothetical protein [Saccharofermentans sp.]
MGNDRNILLARCIGMADSVEDLMKLLSSNDLIDNLTFLPIDDFSNASIILNQSSTSLKGLVEVINNAADATLQRYCDENKINLDQIDVDYYAARKAILGYSSLSELPYEKANRSIADISVLASGSSNNYPNLYIWDRGIGVHPDNFRSTFLKLGSSNKSSNLLNGAFGCGSNAVLPFCNKGYRAIISKHYKSNKVGIILTRKHDLTSEDELVYKQGWFEYAVWSDSHEIPCFTLNDDETLELNDGIWFTDGTILKLFEFELLKSLISINLWERLNIEMPDPIFPFEIKDLRYDTRTKLVRGNYTRLNDNKNLRFSKEYSLHVESDAILPIKVFITKKDVSHASLIGAGRALSFLINGVSQFDIPSTFISQNLEFHHLRKNLVIYVDCSNLAPRYRDQLFMPSRDRCREGPFKDKIINMLTEVLKTDTDLLNINEEYRFNISVNSTSDDHKLISSLLSKMSPTSKELFFSPKGLIKPYRPRTPKPNENSSTNNKELFEYPSYFYPMGFHHGSKAPTKTIVPNKIITFTIDSDCTNDFLSRDNDPGRLEFAITINQLLPGAKVINKNQYDIAISSPINGCIDIALRFAQNLITDGDIINLSVTCKTSKKNYSFDYKLIVNTPELIERSEDTIKKEKKKEYYPEAIRIYENSDDINNWKSSGMSGSDVVRVISSSNYSIEKIFINLDSDSLKEIIASSDQSQSIERIQTEFFLTVYLSTIGLYKCIQKSLSDDKLFEELTDSNAVISELMEKLPELISSILEDFASAAYTIRNI